MAVLGFYHDDLVLSWPGNNHLAGDHVGQAASIDALLTLQTLTNRVPTEIVDVLEGAHSVMAVVIERWISPTDPNRILDVTRALDFTVVDEKLRTCRIFETDQPTVDAWIDAEGAS